MLGAVALGPVALLTRGLPEYESGPDGLRLTLLRCVGVIARPPGLPTRPQGAGPGVLTPEGQCHGTHELEYALRFDANDLTDAALIRAGQDYRIDFAAGDAFEAPLALEGDLVFSSLKGAEDGDGLVLRVFNPGSAAERLGIPGREARRIPARRGMRSRRGAGARPPRDRDVSPVSGSRVVPLRLRRALPCAFSLLLLLIAAPRYSIESARSSAQAGCKRVEP